MEQKMFILTWSANCFIIANSIDNQAQASTIPDTKTLDPVVTLSTQDNIKLLDQLVSGFKRSINWNKYQSKATIQTRNRYLNYLIDPSFQRVNRSFLLSFEKSKKHNNVLHY